MGIALTLIDLLGVDIGTDIAALLGINTALNEVQDAIEIHNFFEGSLPYTMQLSNPDNTRIDGTTYQDVGYTVQAGYNSNESYYAVDLRQETGNSTVQLGSDDNDIVYGSVVGSDTLSCGSGNFQNIDCTASTGSNAIFGGPGFGDALRGGQGSDVLVADSNSGYTYEFAGTGSETLIGGEGTTEMHGNAVGYDLLQGGGGTAYMYAGGAPTEMQGASGVDYMYDTSGTGQCTMVGGSGTDFLVAGAGDTVFAGIGQEFLYAAPNATLNAGVISFTGDHGPDDFVFNSAANSNYNAFTTITGFNTYKDTIDLSSFDAANNTIAHFSNGSELGAVNVNYGADGNTWITVHGAAGDGSQDIFFEIEGQPQLTAANFHH